MRVLYLLMFSAVLSACNSAKAASQAVQDYIVGIFSSSPNTGNDKLDKVLVDAKPTNDGNKGYEYPGSQEELVELVSNQAW